MVYQGSCHCGAVQFEVLGPEEVECQECNCSICSMSGFLHLIVPRANFKLLHGSDKLQTYTFNTATAKHLFCTICGIKSFYIPRSNPDGYSVNVRCLKPQPSKVLITEFDGQNWEQHASSLTHLSNEQP